MKISKRNRKSYELIESSIVSPWSTDAAVEF